MKKLCALILLIIIISSCAADVIIEVAEPTAEVIVDKPVFDMLEIYIFDAGKADAILIMTENYIIMIDTGENRHGEELVQALTDKNIGVIDYLILTHYHKDHIGGAHVIINNIRVKNIIVPNYGKESRHYDRLVNAVSDAGLESFILKEELSLTIDSAVFNLYPAQSEYYFYADSDDDIDEDGDFEDEDEPVTNENNFSIVTSINHGANNFLFTGDAKAKRLREVLRTGSIMLKNYDFLKVPHHGGHNKRSQEFIYAISPDYAVITCSPEDMPDSRVIDALEDVGSEIFLTVHGGVYVKSDGNRIIIEHRSLN